MIKLRFPDPSTRCYYCYMPSSQRIDHPTGAFYVCDMLCCKETISKERASCYHAPTREVRTSCMLFLLLCKIRDYEQDIYDMIREYTMKSPMNWMLFDSFPSNKTKLQDLDKVKAYVNAYIPNDMKGYLIIILSYLQSYIRVSVRRRMPSILMQGLYPSLFNWNIHPDDDGCVPVEELHALYNEFILYCQKWDKYRRRNSHHGSHHAIYSEKYFTEIRMPALPVPRILFTPLK